MVVLSFDRLEKSYGRTVALRGVTFDVPAGEIFGLLGPNGAGKSTLIRVLMDIIRPDAGTVRVFGEPRRREHLDRLGYLPEERGLYTKLRVIDVLTYFGALKGLTRADARQRALEWLERVELPHVSTWKVDRLSKGMSQKVQIAGALMSDPELCVLDEPTTGLDPVNVRLVQDLLLERRRNGRTTILSTHHMNQVEALCDRVALIHKGQLMVYGAVDEVRRRYSLPEVLIQSSAPLPAVAMAASVARESGTTWRVRLSDGCQPVGAARRARRRRRVNRSLRADAGADGGHLPADRRGGPHDSLVQGPHGGGVRVHVGGQAHRLPGGHLRHAAVHGGVRRDRRRPGLLRRPARSGAAGGLRRRRSPGPAASRRATRRRPRRKSTTTRGRCWRPRARARPSIACCSDRMSCSGRSPPTPRPDSRWPSATCAATSS